MATIKEDYCDFEIAKLLKEKGFDEYCRASYNLENGELSQFLCHCYGDNRIQAPTLQMAMKWLREVHDIVICIEPLSYDTIDEKFSSYIFNYWIDDNYIETYGEKKHELCGKCWSSYEETVEAAIRFCLKNLI